jgi:hypothetical protein
VTREDIMLLFGMTMRRGMPEEFITCMKSLVVNPIEYYSCFISYSTKDQGFAKWLHGDLQNGGEERFLSAGLHEGTIVRRWSRGCRSFFRRRRSPGGEGGFALGSQGGGEAVGIGELVIGTEFGGGAKKK